MIILSSSLITEFVKCRNLLNTFLNTEKLLNHKEVDSCHEQLLVSMFEVNIGRKKMVAKINVAITTKKRFSNDT